MFISGWWRRRGRERRKDGSTDAVWQCMTSSHVAEAADWVRWSRRYLTGGGGGGNGRHSASSFNQTVSTPRTATADTAIVTGSSQTRARTKTRRDLRRLVSPRFNAARSQPGHTRCNSQSPNPHALSASCDELLRTVRWLRLLHG